MHLALKGTKLPSSHIATCCCAIQWTKLTTLPYTISDKSWFLNRWKIPKAIATLLHSFSALKSPIPHPTRPSHLSFYAWPNAPHTGHSFEMLKHSRFRFALSELGYPYRHSGVTPNVYISCITPKSTGSQGKGNKVFSVSKSCFSSYSISIGRGIIGLCLSPAPTPDEHPSSNIQWVC